MAAPPFVCHSTKVLHFYGGLRFCHELSQLQSSSLPSPSGRLLTANSSPLPGYALQTPCSSTQSPRTLADSRFRLLHTGLWHGPSV